MQYALKNNPEPLSDKHAKMLSWDGATERLYEASAIPKKEVDAEGHDNGGTFDYEKSARLHIESTKKSKFVTDLLRGKTIKKAFSSVSASSDA
jgi:hypothetical protein